jgi:hypothetical protein
MLVNDSDFLLNWNQKFPLDRWYRKKYNISFNSIQHRSVSYIDIFYEWLEDELVQHYTNKAEKENEKISQYKKTGRWLRTAEENINQEEFVKKFDDLDISAFNEPNDTVSIEE